MQALGVADGRIDGLSEGSSLGMRLGFVEGNKESDCPSTTGGSPRVGFKTEGRAELHDGAELMLGIGELLGTVSPFPSLEPPFSDRPSLERLPLSLELPTIEPPTLDFLSLLSFEWPILECSSRMIAPSCVSFLLRRPLLILPGFKRYCFDRFCFELADGIFDTSSFSSIVLEEDRVLIVLLSDSVLSSDFDVSIVGSASEFSPVALFRRSSSITF